MIEPMLATPIGNTGSKRQVPHESISSHPDYIVVCGVGDVKGLKDEIWAAFGTKFDDECPNEGFRGRHYDAVEYSAQGLELAILYSDDSSWLDKWRLSIPGAPLSHCKSHRLWKFFLCLLARRVVVTRLDWAIDVFDGSLPLESACIAARQGNYSRCKTYRYYESSDQGYGTGRSLYFGSGKSDKMVRIYDKAVESRGAVPSVSFEYYLVVPDWSGGLNSCGSRVIPPVSQPQEFSLWCPTRSDG